MLATAGRLDLDLSLNQGIIQSVRPDRARLHRPRWPASALCLTTRPVDASRCQNDDALEPTLVVVNERQQELILQERKVHLQREVEPARRKLGCQVDLPELAERGALGK